MDAQLELLTEAYRHFNDRNVEAVLDLMHLDVDWPNGMEGGRVHGRAAVRDYWIRQWSVINPRVDPVGFETVTSGRILVTVQQTVRDLGGNVLAEQKVIHSYVIEDSLIRRMDIEAADEHSMILAED